MNNAAEIPASFALRLEGSEVLIAALDNHMRTCDMAKTLARQNGELHASMSDLRLRYAQLLGALLQSMRTDLFLAGWCEVRPSIWRSPEGTLFRGSEAAWKEFRALSLRDVQQDGHVRNEGD